jgi:hypothetical protein
VPQVLSAVVAPPRTQPRPIMQADPPPGQQRWPLAPQVMHIPPWPFMAPKQARPLWQFAPGQHA